MTAMTSSAMLLILVSATLISAAAGNLQKYRMEINEVGVHFNETIYVDEEAGFEIIKVPKHRYLSGLTIFTDFKKRFSIYKVVEAKTCYVVTLDPEIEAPSSLAEGVTRSQSKFPYHKFTMEVDNFFTKGEVNPNTIIGKTAAKFCKQYPVLHAAIFRGGDIDRFAIEQLKASIQDGGNKRDAAIRDFYTCNKKESDFAMRELSRCKGQLNYYHANCKFSTSSCVYRVRCPYDLALGYWRCAGNHRFHNMVCCTYSCSLK